MDTPALGIVRVRLDALDFYQGRAVSKDIVLHLKEVFRIDGCNREHDQNVIPANIPSANLDQLLVASGLTRSELQLSLIHPSHKPLLNTGKLRIQCLHGRHRVEAAKQILQADDFWWTVKIRSFDEIIHQQSLLREVKHFSHETPLSDGEIYYEARLYMNTHNLKARDSTLARMAMTCLKSHSKRRDLVWLLQKPGYTDMLDNIMQFPGLTWGLELGNIRRHFALRCHEELQRYLSRTYEIWSTITLHSSTNRQSVDVKTVKFLQGRVPMASVTDRLAITRMMASGDIFSSITCQATRQEIQNSLLSLHDIIPTLKTFHENAKLLEIGVKIIRSQLEPCRDGSLFESLLDFWLPPDTCLIETAEGVFYEALIPPGLDKQYLAYVQLFVSAIRQSRNLSHIPPRRVVRNSAEQAGVDHKHQILFAKRTQLLGFQTKSVEEKCNESVARLKEPLMTTTPRGLSIEERYRRPSGETQKQLQGHLFIPNLIRAQDMELREPTAMFVLQDFIKSFFRPGVVSEWIIRNPAITIFSSETSVVINPPAQSLCFQDLRNVILSPNISDDASEAPSAITHMSLSPCLDRNGTPSSAVLQITNNLIHTDIRASSDEIRSTGNDEIRSTLRECHKSEMNDTGDESTEPLDGTQPDVHNAPATTERLDTRSIVEVQDVITTDIESLQVSRRSSKLSHSYCQKDYLECIPHVASPINDQTRVSSGSYRHRRIASISQYSTNLGSNTETEIIPRNTDEMSMTCPSPTPDLDTYHPARLESDFKERRSSPKKTWPQQWTRSYVKMPDFDKGPEDFEIEDVANITTEQSSSQNFVINQPTRSYVAPAGQINFLEHNGMNTVVKSTKDMRKYLEKRKGWVGMVIDDGVPRSIRTDHIVHFLHTGHSRERSFILAKQPFAERLRKSYIENLGEKRSPREVERMAITRERSFVLLKRTSPRHEHRGISRGGEGSLLGDADLRGRSLVLAKQTPRPDYRKIGGNVDDNENIFGDGGENSKRTRR